MADELDPGTEAAPGAGGEGAQPQGAPEPAGAGAPQASTTSPAADWRGTLPAAWADKLKDVGDEADALRALTRGLGYTPAQKPEDVELTYPDGVTVDKAVSDSFRQFCVDKGITPAQAQALLDWQLAANREMRDAAVASGKAALQKQWGSRFGENSALALKAVTALDKRLGGRLSEALAFTGMSNDPVLVEAFHAVATLISEDSLSGGTGAGATDKPESAEETYRNMFK